MQSFSIEHIKPASRAGSNKESNLALSCQGCNSHKYVKIQALESQTQIVVRLFHPRRDKWKGHFSWGADNATIRGLTTIGRATIGVLQLNRTGVLNLRLLLVRAGLYPPSD